MSWSRWTASFALLACLHAVPGFACRYNVRDLGFVDLGGEAYRLVAYARRNTPEATTAQFQRVALDALRESNVQVEWVNLDTHPDHPARKHLRDELEETGFTAVLVSPDGQEMPVSAVAGGRSPPGNPATALREIVSSPTRTEILRAVSEAFGAVLLIEGTNAEENRKAQQVVSAAIEQVRSQLNRLPKAIAQPPRLVVLGAGDLRREKILLWSLGLDGEPTRQPRAAVIYGRARWIGPLMKGEEIAEHNLTGILSIIGADCECGLDIAWTQGTRLPVKWEEPLHAEVTKTLGFDPESPMVKIEASRIVGRGGASTRASVGDAQDSVAADRQGAERTGTEAHAVAIPPTPAPSPEDSNRALLVEGNPVATSSSLVLAALVVFAGIAGGWIVLRAARKH